MHNGVIVYSRLLTKPLRDKSISSESISSALIDSCMRMCNFTVMQRVGSLHLTLRLMFCFSLSLYTVHLASKPTSEWVDARQSEEGAGPSTHSGEAVMKQYFLAPFQGETLGWLKMIPIYKPSLALSLCLSVSPCVCLL